MGDELAATALQLRPPAGNPLGETAFRPASRARRDAGMTAPAHALTTEHSPVAGLAHDARGGISNPILGMLLFITSEVMFFAGLFGAYFTVRASAPHWPT